MDISPNETHNARSKALRNTSSTEKRPLNPAEARPDTANAAAPGGLQKTSLCRDESFYQDAIPHGTRCRSAGLILDTTFVPGEWGQTSGASFLGGGRRHVSLRFPQALPSGKATGVERKFVQDDPTQTHSPWAHDSNTTLPRT